MLKTCKIQAIQPRKQLKLRNIFSKNKKRVADNQKKYAIGSMENS